MCAKHTACQSNKVASQPASNSCCSPKLAINKVTAISSIANGGETCCASEACSSSDTSEEAERPDLTLSSFAAERQSWLISGMDCPSCAQKLEKAILGIPGVNHAKVLFSTEKLVVDFDSLSLVSAIEQTAEKTGFPLCEGRFYANQGCRYNPTPRRSRVDSSQLVYCAHRIGHDHRCSVRDGF